MVLRPYTTLVVKDFQNAVGDALPGEALTQIPGAVVAHLKECYPKAFTRIERALEVLLGHSQASALSEASGDPSGTRTPDSLLKRQELYRLS